MLTQERWELRSSALKEAQFSGGDRERCLVEDTKALTLEGLQSEERASTQNWTGTSVPKDFPEHIQPGAPRLMEETDPPSKI